MPDTNRAFSTFEAQLLVYRAMCEMPILENGSTQPEFRQLVRVRAYLRKQCDIALEIPRNCFCDGGMLGDEECPCCEGKGSAPANRIAEFEAPQPIVGALDMCAVAESL